jgi:putative endonuclease
MWTLYLLECRSGAYYAGITNDLDARFKAHCEGKGAKYTRSNPPVRILASRRFRGRSRASQAEYALKQLPRSEKLAFFGKPFRA